MKLKNIIILFLFIASIMFSYITFEDQTKISDNKNTKEDKTSGAYDALNFWTMARAYPNDDIPNIARYSAYEQAKLNDLYKTEKLLLTDQWQTIGPHNKGGRTNVIAFNPQNPNTMYAGTASGGLW